MGMVSDSADLNRRKLVARGIAWYTLYQTFQVALTFGSMLILVRVIPAAEYGRVSVVLGWLTLLNALSCGVFMEQALQLPDGIEPDWSLHWSAGLYIQATLSGICHALAGLCWLVAAYKPIAPLLHLAALGLIIDSPNRLGFTMLQRAMAFQRLCIVRGLGMFVSLGVTIGLGLAGCGAYAIVLGSNVVTALPFTVDLLFVRRWRPQPGWWRWPDWAAYRPALRFGLQQAGSGLLYAARGTLEATVLPVVLGYTSIGLLNRAQALFSTTIGRVVSILVETVYPLLPRYAADPQQYSRHATLFAQIIFLIVLPGTLYVGLEGTALSRLFYGEKWVAADPLIWPGAMIGLGLAMFMVGGTVLLAVNRLRTCFALNLVAAGLSVPIVGVAWAGGGIMSYAWAVAVGQLLAGGIALATASPLLISGWILLVLVPPMAGSILAAGARLAYDSLWVQSSPVVHLSISSAVYVIVMMLTLRILFPSSLAAALSRLPGGPRLQGWLRLLPPSIRFS
jgi:O-antigen/teichoic acid export membrane protein